MSALRSIRNRGTLQLHEIYLRDALHYIILTVYITLTMQLTVYFEVKDIFQNAF